MSSELHEESTVPAGTRRYQTSPLLGGIELLTADYRHHVFPPHAQETVVLGLVERGRIEVTSRGVSMSVTEGRHPVHSRGRGS